MLQFDAICFSENTAFIYSSAKLSRLLNAHAVFAQDQGCQISRGTTYQKRERNVPNGHNYTK
jgi:hypothetical protein